MNMGEWIFLRCKGKRGGQADTLNDTFHPGVKIGQHLIAFFGGLGFCEYLRVRMA
jgi:hypothetical protein